MVKSLSISFVIYTVVVLMFSGCYQTLLWPIADQVLSPLDAMNEEAKRGRWFEAWQYFNAVQEQHGDDPKVLAHLAWVAYECNHHETAADLLMAACRVEFFANDDRVEQAVVAAIFVGRLFDALDFLYEAVSAQPDQLSTRRLIYDLLIGIEERTKAEPHGRYLIQKRRFDTILLASLCNTGRNPLEPMGLKEMITRNPADKRPLIAKALSALEKKRYEDAIVQLEEILDAHPESVQAQILLGEAIIGAADFSLLSSWESRLQGEYEQEPGYWLTVGRWASHRQDHVGAATAYWQATERDSLLTSAWEGLRLELRQVGTLEIAVTSETLTAIENRIRELQRLKQTKLRFVRSRSISRVLAIEVGLSLLRLGRLWEAEAWLAVAHTLPEDPTADVAAARDAVLAKLHAKTPWQLREGHPEMQLDLSLLPLPVIQTK